MDHYTGLFIAAGLTAPAVDVLAEALTRRHWLTPESAARLRRWGGPALSSAVIMYLRSRHAHLTEARLERIEALLMSLGAAPAKT